MYAEEARTQSLKVANTKREYHFADIVKTIQTNINLVSKTGHRTCEYIASDSDLEFVGAHIIVAHFQKFGYEISSCRAPKFSTKIESWSDFNKYNQINGTKFTIKW